MQQSSPPSAADAARAGHSAASGPCESGLHIRFVNAPITPVGEAAVSKAAKELLRSKKVDVKNIYQVGRIPESNDWAVRFDTKRRAVKVDELVGSIDIAGNAAIVSDINKRTERGEFTRVEGAGVTHSMRARKPYTQSFTISGLPLGVPKVELMKQLTGFGFKLTSPSQLANQLSKDPELKANGVTRELVEVKQECKFEDRITLAETLSGRRHVVFDIGKFNIIIGGSGVCYRCFKHGHIKSKCTGVDARFAGKPCHACKKVGHLVAKCPLREARQLRLNERAQLVLPWKDSDVEANEPRGNANDVDHSVATEGELSAGHSAAAESEQNAGHSAAVVDSEESTKSSNEASGLAKVSDDNDSLPQRESNSELKESNGDEAMITSSQMEAISAESACSLLGLGVTQCDTLAMDNGNGLLEFATHNAYAHLGEQVHGNGLQDETMDHSDSETDEHSTTVIHTVSLLPSNSGPSQSTPSGSKRRRHGQSSSPKENNKAKSKPKKPKRTTVADFLNVT